MVTRRDALKSAIRLRRCPPYFIKQTPEYREEYKAHCLICPFCEPDKESDLDGWEMVADDFVKTFYGNWNPEDEKVQPGDIRLLKRNKNLWNSGFYYSPPVVMVLKKDPDSEGYLPVAQIFSEPLLAGPGDLVTGSLFVETWNIFHVKIESLGEKIDKKDQVIVDAVIAMHRNKSDVPDWAQLPMPIKPGDPRELFRRYERETADFFNENRTMPPIFNFLDKISMIEELRKKAPGISWDAPPKTMWDLFATADLPDDYYPKAAADEEFLLYYHAVLYIYKNNEIEDIRMVRAEAECTPDDSGITYSIFFPELPVPSEGVFGYSYLKLSPIDIIAPLEIKAAMEKRSISVSFKSGDCSAGTLQTALFCMKD